MRRRSRPVGLLLPLLLAACGEGATGPSVGRGERGRLVSATLVTTAPAAVIARAIALGGAGAGFVAKYDVRQYAILYRTIDVEGKATTASGAVFLPILPVAGTSPPVPLMSYSHGTASSRTDVPSNPQSYEGATVGALFATGGAVVAMADYLGLGSGTGFHPYIHAASEASAGLDALRAARAVAAQERVALDAKLFVFGYSQGGHAAMALAREIEQHATPEFTLTAAAPMSGPYDVTNTAKTFLADPTPNLDASSYTVAALASYQAVYHLADRMDLLFRKPYDGLATGYLTGALTSDQLGAGLAPTPAAMVQPAFAATLNDASSAASRALRDNDVYDWTPHAPMRLYYGSADRNVPPQNALTAAARMRSLGADVQAVNLGPLTHGGAVLPAMIGAGLFFRGLR